MAELAIVMQHSINQMKKTNQLFQEQLTRSKSHMTTDVDNSIHESNLRVIEECCDSEDERDDSAIGMYTSVRHDTSD